MFPNNRCKYVIKLIVTHNTYSKTYQNKIQVVRNHERRRELDSDTGVCDPRLILQVSMMPKLPQMDLIAELKRRQVSPLVREGKDGAIEDIITGRTQPPGRQIQSVISQLYHH